jgi:hypothetical protein
MILEVLKDFDNGMFTKTQLIEDENQFEYKIIVGKDENIIRVYNRSKFYPPMITIIKVNDNIQRKTRYHYNTLRMCETFSFPLNCNEPVLNDVLYCNIDDGRFTPEEIDRFQVLDVYSEYELFQLSTITHINVSKLIVLKEIQKRYHSMNLNHNYVCKGLVNTFDFIKELEC